MRSKWSVVAWSVPLILGLAGWANLSLAQDPVKKAEPPKPEPKKEEPKKADAPAEKDIVAVAKDTAALKTFYKLLDEAGLLKQLQEKGPFTVFAPPMRPSRSSRSWRKCRKTKPRSRSCCSTTSPVASMTPPP